MTQIDQNTQDEIDLREIFIVLWKRKILIISATLIGAILAGLLSIFVLSPVYDTELKVDLNVPATYNTRYGEYKLPISSNSQYIDLIESNNVITNVIKDMGYISKNATLQSLKKRIVIGKIYETLDNPQNIFDITVSAKTPDESLKLANTLYENYTKYLDVVLNEKALNYFYNDFSASIKSDEDKLRSTQVILKENEELLAKTPQTIDQGSLNNTSNIVIQEIINPKYSKIQENIVENKQLIFMTQDKINVNKGYIKAIKAAKSDLKKYSTTGKLDEFEARIINFTDTNIFLAATPVAPTNKTSPSTTQNTGMGLAIGCILSVMIVLVKDYWFKNE